MTQEQNEKGKETEEEEKEEDMTRMKRIQWGRTKKKWKMQRRGKYQISAIDYFTVFCSVTWPLNGSEAGGDLGLIQTSLILLCKSSCSNANWVYLHDKIIEVCIKARSHAASLSFKCQVTEQITVKLNGLFVLAVVIQLGRIVDYFLPDFTTFLTQIVTCGMECFNYFSDYKFWQRLLLTVFFSVDVQASTQLSIAIFLCDHMNSNTKFGKRRQMFNLNSCCSWTNS